MRIHISLNVSSIDRSRAFYAALFGCPASKVESDYANFRLDEPPIHLALQGGRSVGSAGAGHFGIELPDRGTLAEWRRRLRQAGLPVTVEEDAACCYARGEKLWSRDPDGHCWEIWVRTGEYPAMGRARVLEEIVKKEEAVCC
jgi:catechol 2,3-dioxygenase-like lactoylglutathione lyase family enzyme